MSKNHSSQGRCDITVRRMPAGDVIIYLHPEFHQLWKVLDLRRRLIDALASSVDLHLFSH